VTDKASVQQAPPRATAQAPRIARSRIPLLLVAAWAIPGAGHLWLGRVYKGAIFLVTVPLMFAVGLWLQGRVFPLEIAQPLVALAALADAGIGLPYFAARLLGGGAGEVTAITYEYGNTFLIVAGLLNMLIVLDAFDVAEGRK
jgi:hypothetical protein